MTSASRSIASRMKPLPRRHRRAHLHALIRQERTPSRRLGELLALLRDEAAAQENEDHAR